MSGRSLLVLFVVLFVVTACLPGGVAATARGASPAADAGSYAGSLNLPAMVLTPADLEAAGFPGYGKFGDGTFVPFDVLVTNTAAFRGLPAAEVRAAYEAAGWLRFYGSTLGVPSVPGDRYSRTNQVAWSFVNEYADEAGAADAFASLGRRGDDPQARIADVAGTKVFGDESRIEATVVVEPEFGSGTGLSLLFRRDTLIGGAGFEVSSNAASMVAAAAYAPPAAAPVAGSAAPTVAAVEPLAARLLAKIEATRAAGDPGLSVPALRLDRATAPVVYESEGYRIQNGETPPFYGGFADDILALPTVVADVQAVYEVEQLLQLGEEPADTNPYFLLRLIRFADVAAASTFLAAFPAALTAGAGTSTGAALLADGAVDLGDESVAVAFRAGDAGSPPAAYELYVRVGTTVVTVFLGSTLRPDLAIVAELAAAQVACLEAGACVPVPMPAALGAASGAFA